MKTFALSLLILFSSISFTRPAQAVDCNYVASKFSQDLRICWRANSSGCIQYYTRTDVMSDQDFHTCKHELYSACIRTCHSVWGVNDTGCAKGCTIIGKYL